MFNKETNVMLYVDNVVAEKAFWSAIGFHIFNETELMGYDSFEMKPHLESNLTFTIYAKDFIATVSPEVLEMKPSVLFETNDIDALQDKVAAVTDTASQVNQVPFPNFNFANPSGHYFAVKGL